MTRTSQVIAESIHSSVDLIKKSHFTVVLTGAGLSTPSGIPDFRSPGTGLWTRYQPMEVASLTTFRHHPEMFYSWLHPMAELIITAQPNPAHFAIAALQDNGYISTIITQNIDGLLTRAGAKNVLEVHGTLSTLTCIRCFRQVPSNDIIQEYITNCKVPLCPECGGILKPDAILYEEQLPIKIWIKAEEACRKCELLLIAGTSLEVMPSAKLPILALEKGASVVIINNTETYLDVRANIIIRGDVAEIFPLISDEVLNA